LPARRFSHRSRRSRWRPGARGSSWTSSRPPVPRSRRSRRFLLQQQRLASSRGALQTASGQFDPQLSASLLRARDTLPFTDGQIEQTDQLYDARHEHDGVPPGAREGLPDGPDDQSPAGGRSRGRQRVGRRHEPRGRRLPRDATAPARASRDVVTAQETAARLEVEATTLDLRQVIASSVVRTVQAYWAISPRSAPWTSCGRQRIAREPSWTRSRR